MGHSNIEIGETYKEQLNYPNDFRYCFPVEIETKATVNACINISKYFAPFVYYEHNCSELDENREYITQLVLEKISSLNIEISGWADKVLATYNQIKDRIEKSGYAKEQEILLDSGKKLYLSLCSYEEIKSLDDVEYFLVHNEFNLFCSSSESLYTIACNIVNADKTRELLEKDKKSLFSYYQAENIEQLLSLPSEDRSESQENTLSSFSDRYKDVYGHRPNGLDNECQHFLDQEKNQNHNITDDYEYEKGLL